MAIRYGRGDVKQTTTGFRGPLMVQSLTSAKSKFLSLQRQSFNTPPKQSYNCTAQTTHHFDGRFKKIAGVLRVSYNIRYECIDNNRI